MTAVPTCTENRDLVMICTSHHAFKRDMLHERYQKVTILYTIHDLLAFRCVCDPYVVEFEHRI